MPRGSRPPRRCAQQREDPAHELLTLRRLGPDLLDPLGCRPEHAGLSRAIPGFFNWVRIHPRSSRKDGQPTDRRGRMPGTREGTSAAGSKYQGPLHCRPSGRPHEHSYDRHCCSRSRCCRLDHLAGLITLPSGSRRSFPSPGDRVLRYPGGCSTNVSIARPRRGVAGSNPPVSCIVFAATRPTASSHGSCGREASIAWSMNASRSPRQIPIRATRSAMPLRPSRRSCAMRCSSRAIQSSRS